MSNFVKKSRFRGKTVEDWLNKKLSSEDFEKIIKEHKKVSWTWAYGHNDKKIEESKQEQIKLWIRNKKKEYRPK